MAVPASRWVRALLVAGSCACLAPAAASAHLCNDVFAQAKDNLAVKVDIRDGQLRIAEEASFRVYLLNTMDRDIADINLLVVSEQFKAEVQPSSAWRTFPLLRTIAKGGKKEHFEVTLTRKPGVRDGKYRIELHLVNGKDHTKTIKATDLSASADSYELPRAKGIRVDGSAGADEWKKALLVSDFYTYEQTDKFYENVRAADQPRYRLAVDDTYLYALFSVRKAGGADVAALYAAKDPDAAPVAVEFDLQTGKASGAADVSEVLCRLSTAKDALEARIPRKFLGLEGKDVTGFYVNFRRTKSTDAPRRPTQAAAPVVSYWRGNSFSLLNPVVYARLAFAPE